MFFITPLEVAAVSAIVALLSLAVATTALLYARKTFIRAGPRIHVKVSDIHQRGGSFADGTLSARLTVHNSGLAEIDIKSIQFVVLKRREDIIGSDFIERSELEGPPCRIPSNKDLTWTFDIAPALRRLVGSARLPPVPAISVLRPRDLPTLIVNLPGDRYVAVARWYFAFRFFQAGQRWKLENARRLYEERQQQHIADMAESEDYPPTHGLGTASATEQ